MLMDGSTETVELVCEVPVVEGQRVAVAYDGGAYKVISVGQVVEIANGAAEKADKADHAAQEAAKIATNYIGYENGQGLVVGDMTTGDLGSNVLIDADSVEIRNGMTVLATFAAALIEIGKNAASAVISLCGGKGQISYGKTDYGRFEGLTDTSERLLIAGGKVGIRTDELTSIWSSKSTQVETYDAGIVVAGEVGLYAGLASEVRVRNAELLVSPNGISAHVDEGSVSLSAPMGSFLYNEGNVYGAHVLYDNESGTTGTVALSQSTAYFEYIDIIYGNGEGRTCGLTRVFSPNGKVAELSAVLVGDNGWHAAYTIRYSISGRTLVPVFNNRVGSSLNGTEALATDALYCVAVVGYR